VVAVGEGSGPVNALDRALHQALDTLFPALAGLELTDYQVRIPTGERGSAAPARVLATFVDGRRRWSTVGVDENLTTASWHALLDAFRYTLRDSAGPLPASAAAQRAQPALFSPGS
jgi:2-isopropylmalate synthase